jgi:hypothetical protein
MTSPNDPISALRLTAMEREALGNLRSVHKAGTGMLKFNIVGASLFTFLAAVLPIASFYTAIVSPGRGWEGAGVMSGLITLLPLGWLVWFLLKLRWCLYLFENGFVFSRGKNFVVLWEDVKFVYERQDLIGEIRADRWLHVVRLDKRDCRLDSSCQNFVMFCEAVQIGATRAIVARVTASLAKGESVSFGLARNRLVMSQTGLKQGGRTVSWGEVHSIVCVSGPSGGGFHICVKDPRGPGGKDLWDSYPGAFFANYLAFLELAAKYTTVVSPRSGS